MRNIELAVVGLFAAVGVLAGVEAIDRYVQAHGWKPLSISDWATWVGALGTIAAIIVTFNIFQHQRRNEQERAKDDELLRRTKSVQVVQDVAVWAIQVVGHCIEVKGNEYTFGIVSDVTPRLDELRVLLDRFVDQRTERNIVVSALFLSHALMETKSDLRTEDPELGRYVYDRMVERKEKMERAHDQLIRQMIAMQNLCAERGLAWESPYALPDLVFEVETPDSL